MTLAAPAPQRPLTTPRRPSGRRSARAPAADTHRAVADSANSTGDSSAASGK